MRPTFSFVGIALAFLLGALLGVLGFYGYQSSARLSLPMKDSLQQDGGVTGTNLINPLLDCADLTSAINEPGIERLRTQVSQYILAQKSSGALFNASVYYRDLNNGPWMIVGENETYSPGSLLKIPIALSYYRQEESSPGFLEKKIVYKTIPSISDAVQPYAPTENVVNGQTYTVKDLIRIMLEQSSNDAAATLISSAGSSQVRTTFGDLGLPAPVADQNYTIGIHDFSSFLRVLYNATYLTKADSEEVLTMLSKTSYKEGLVAGVPGSLTVAHKFGTRGEDDGTVDLHDCGIIYVPNNPYILCVMTHGTEFATLSSIVAHLSSLVYQYTATN